MNDLDRSTQNALDGMWRNLFGKVRLLVQQELRWLKIRVADLSDVNIGTLADGDALVWDTTTNRWINGEVAGPGGATAEHGAYIALPLPWNVIPAGPKNKTSNNWFVTAVNVITDGECVVSCTGVTDETFAAGGGEVDYDLDALEDVQIVPPDGRFWIYVDPATLGGDATYVAVSWAVLDDDTPVDDMSARYGSEY